MERRRILWFSACLIGGVYFVEYMGVLLLPAMIGSALLTAAVLILSFKRPLLRGLVLFPLAFLAGILLWQCEMSRFEDLEAYKGKMVEVNGTVYGLEGLGDTLRMSSAVLRVNGKEIPLQRDVRLRLKGEGRVPEGINGCSVTLRTVWKPAESAANPRGFDYGEYLRRSGFQAELRISPWQIGDKKQGRVDFRAMLYAFRGWYGQTLLKVLPVAEGSVAYGMAIGDTVLIPQELADSYRISGLGHILSVSGLHFAILYGWLQRMFLKVPLNEKTKNAVIIAVLTFMGFLNGWTSPALRAWGMILLLIIAKRSFRQYDGLSALSAVAVLTAVLAPLSVLQPGFQFSYGAVLGLITLTRPLMERMPLGNQHLKEYFAASISVQGAVVPLGIFWFGFWNPISLIVNFPVMILSEWLMPLLVIFPFTVLLGDAGLWLSGKAIGILVGGMNACSAFMNPQAKDWLLPSPEAGRIMAVLLLILLGARLLIAVVGGEDARLRTNQALLTAALLLFGSHLTWTVAPQITFLSVGQGDAALVRFENRTLLIDAGPASAKLDRLLLRNGITRIDTLFITHGHEDHIGGAVDILKHLKVRQIVIGTEEPANPLYVDMIETARKRGVPVRLVQAGDLLYPSGKRAVKVLYPFENKAQEDANAHSLTLLYQERDFKTLFTGDLVKAGEAALLERDSLPDVDLLKVPHHGSGTSSSPEWLERIRPERAVISVGVNLYGLPNRGIMDAYREAGVFLYRTDDSGAVRITLSPHRKSMKTWRVP